MFKVLVISAFVACASANGYGGGSSGGYGGSGGGYGGGGSAGGYGGGIIPAAIQTIHNIEYKDVPSTGSIQAATIEVGASAIPINILFRSASSNLNVLQQHQGAGGDTQETSSEDEPHRLLHTVTKPIFQEVREVISPFRKITQEIQPVQEEIQTIVARGIDQGRGLVGGGGSSLGLGGSIGGGLGGGLVIGGGSGGSVASAGGIEIKASSGTGLGKGLSGKSAGSYASSAKASSSSTKGGY